MNQVSTKKLAIKMVLTTYAKTVLVHIIRIIIKITSAAREEKDEKEMSDIEKTNQTELKIGN